MKDAPFEVLPLHGGFSVGAQIVALEFESLTDAEVHKSLYDLWLQKRMLIFRGTLGADGTSQVFRYEALGRQDLNVSSSGHDVRGLWPWSVSR
jgi:hypothetical protein